MNSPSAPNYIPVLLCFDANYAHYAAVATYSAHKNAKSRLLFYWLSTADCRNLSEQLSIHLQQFGIDIKLVALELNDISKWKTGFHFTIACYLRLLAANVLMNEDKVIYIDCDTIVLTDLRDLYDIDLVNSFFAGVVDEAGGSTSKVPRAIDDKYINSGVLLMNMRRLREDAFWERSKYIYKEFEHQITWPDQCIINKYAEGRKVILDQRWNRQIFTDKTREREFKELADPQKSSILHFVGAVKPWQNWCNPNIKSFWWSYAKDVGIVDLKPTELKTVEQAISFANTLHLTEYYKDSSIVKSNVIDILNRHIEELKKETIENRRRMISTQLNQSFCGIIRYGPFKGFQFSSESWWGAADRANMLLGLYEQEVLACLLRLPKRYRYFIDVGAADGYYGIGVIVGKIFEKSWCYEVSEQGQHIIRVNAQLNNVSDQIVIRGKAGSTIHNDFSEDEAAQSVLFIDIEGGEFELINEKLLEKFKYSIIFIELHDWFFSDGAEQVDRLRMNIEKFFKITSLTTTSRDLSVFNELQKMSDTDRWLICSEGRGRLMTWWRLDPL